MSTHKHETRPSVNPENFNRVDTDELPSIHNVLPSAPEDASRLKKTSRKKFIIGATATAAAAALTTSIFVGISKGNDQPPIEKIQLPKNDKNSAAVHETDPNAHPKIYPMLATDSPTEIATKFTENMSSLQNAGANNYTFKERFTQDAAGGTPSDDEITSKVLAEVRPQYENVLFGTTDETKISPDNVSFINQLQKLEKGVIIDYFATGGDNQAKGTDPYSETITFTSLDSATTNSDGTETITFTATEHEDLNNSVGTQEKADNIPSFDGKQDRITISVKPSNKNVYIESINYNN